MAMKPDKYFILKDGTAVKSLFELSKALNSMPKDVFSHHVNQERNDFSNWVRDVVKDKELAEKMLKAKSSKEMEKLIGKKIQKSVLKSINKKQEVKKEAKPKPQVSRAKKTVKHETDKTVGDKLHELFAGKKDRPIHSNIPKDIKFGLKCPYKTIQCGLLEFVFGIMIGLAIALVLNTML